MAKTQKAASTPQLNADQWAGLLESLNGFIVASSGLAENIKTVVEVIQTKPSTSATGECVPTCKDAVKKTEEKPFSPCATACTQKSSEGEDKGTQKCETAAEKSDTESEPEVDKKASPSKDKISTPSKDKISTPSKDKISSCSKDKLDTSSKDKISTSSKDKIGSCSKECTGTKEAASNTSIEKKSCVPTCKGPGDVAEKKSDKNVTLKGCKTECPAKSILKSKANKKKKKDEAESQKQQMMFLSGLKTNLKNMQCTMAEVEEKIRLMERLVQDYDTKNKPCGELNPAALYKEIMKPQSVPYLKAQRDQKVTLNESSSKTGCNFQTCRMTSSSSGTSSSIDKTGPVKVLRVSALPD